MRVGRDNEEEILQLEGQFWADLKLATRRPFGSPMRLQGPKDSGHPLLLSQAVSREMDDTDFSSREIKYYETC